MPGRHLPLLAAAALVTAAASVAQPQTTDPGTTSTGTATSTPDTATTGSSTSTPDTSTTGSATSTTDAGATSAEQDQSTTGTTASAQAGATTATAATGMGALQGQDAEFLRRAVESDRLEIASAQAALDNAQRSETKAAARMLLEDHQASSQKLQQLASRKGWSMPAAVTSADADQARMTSPGADFDARFTAEQVRMHRDAIALFRQQAASGSDPELRQFASDQLPHLEHHLEMLQGAHTQK
ncbi:MAG TPA: DUF4142 domain-containing protein [Steroidobacteraceae bacterium]|nr:DUF4142 domain-containing protein [Steroidobacteraceae bacterium]